MYYDDMFGIWMWIILGFTIVGVLFSTIFATIDYAIRGKSWGLSFGRTLLTTVTFTLFSIILLILFQDNLFYW